MQAEYILDLQKQLSLLDGEVRKDSNGTLTDETVTSMAPVDKVCMGSYFALSFFALNSIFIIYVNESVSLIDKKKSLFHYISHLKFNISGLKSI